MTSHVAEIFYIARKYYFKQLEDVCIGFLQKNIRPELVFEIMALGDLYALPELIKSCWEYIEDNTILVLTTHMQTLTLDMLCNILENDNLNVKETELFNFVHR